MKCSARSKRSGEQCQKDAVRGSHVCSMHGGTVRKGIASPHWKHGRYSKALPESLAATYKRSMSDPRLMDLRSELALCDARLFQLAGKLKANEQEGPNGMAEMEERDLWREMIGTIEARRRLTESIARIDEDNSISAERALAIVGEVATVMRNVVLQMADKQVADAILAAVSREISTMPQLMIAAQHGEAE